jgi:hypothetical protein
MAAERPCWIVAPHLVVDDVVATANYYRDTLGVEYDRFWNEPPSFCGEPMTPHFNEITITAGPRSGTYQIGIPGGTVSGVVKGVASAP